MPLVGTVREFNSQAKVIRDTIEVVFAERGTHMNYLLGTMIETPRGALVADSIGKQAEFFSFGTNDLTQMTLGFSRDDIGKFLPDYLKDGMYDQDPFQSIDQKGVGLLVKMAVEKGRAARPGIKLGVCGEHGGDSGIDRLFPSGRARLCELLAVPGCRLRVWRRLRQRSANSKVAMWQRPALMSWPFNFWIVLCRQYQGQPQTCNQSAAIPCQELEFALVQACNPLDNRQSKSGAAGVCASILKPGKGKFHAFEFSFGYAGAMIENINQYLTIVDAGFNSDGFATILAGVFEEIDECPHQCSRTDHRRRHLSQCDLSSWL